MAYVMEVIYSILEFRGASMEEVEKVRIEKKNRKGAIEKFNEIINWQRLLYMVILLGIMKYKLLY